MLLLKTKGYKKSASLLPKKDHALLSRQEKLLAADMFNPSLHTKKLKGFPGDKVFSFRVTREYRGIFRISEDNIILFAIGHRKDIYQSLD